MALVPSICLTGAVALLPAFNSKPTTILKVDTMALPCDASFPGTIQLTDASHVTLAISKVHAHVPVTHAGDFVMLNPQWLAGVRSPWPGKTWLRGSNRMPMAFDRHE